eukprot:CAMPEP_0115095266 /NCGR_PEP_ID=MMETSP0227-20121206/28887_1 /TAXON_ID=89957 /ORGANISM="Polarella glacialis, Strain CCMP 1383" /LENGTH=67 /DNA_ID=CAMNT_0002488499 /DNA_START=25 /DNA_END=228 /DNA_ORIENTATION=+
MVMYRRVASGLRWLPPPSRKRMFQQTEHAQGTLESQHLRDLLLRLSGIRRMKAKASKMGGFPRVLGR